MTHESVALHFLRKEMAKVAPNSETAHSLGIISAVVENDTDGIISWLMAEMNRLNKEFNQHKEQSESLISAQSTLNSQLKTANQRLTAEAAEKTQALVTEKEKNARLRTILRDERIVKADLEDQLKDAFRKEVLTDSLPPSPLPHMRDRIRVTIPVEQPRRDAGQLDSDEV